MRRRIYQFAPVLLSLLLVCGAACAQDKTTTAPLPPTPAAPPAPKQPPPPAPKGQPVVLDHVIAVVNGDVILQSDVNQEMQLAVLQPFGLINGSTRAGAFQRLLDRSLILQQMKEGQPVQAPTDEQVQQQLTELRKHIPGCPDCATDAGWQAFLKAHQLTEPEVEQYWRRRMLLLNFIEARFRGGIRITPQEIQSYYDNDLLPEFSKRSVKPPALKTISSRIDEILLQQRVNAQLLDWLKSLKEQGSVSILDPAYGQVGTTGAEQDEEPTAGGIH